MSRTPLERTIGGKHWLLSTFPPSKAVGMWGRLMVLFAPLLRGVAGTSLKAILELVDTFDWDDPRALSGVLDQAPSALLGHLRDLLRKVDAEALVAGAFAVRWDDPAVQGIVRDLLDAALCTEGARVIRGTAAFDDAAGTGPFAGPEGLETLVVVLAAVLEANFKLPFFSRTRDEPSPSTALPTP